MSQYTIYVLSNKSLTLNSRTILPKEFKIKHNKMKYVQVNKFF